jgi:trimeric autotransporter adhesin
MAQKRSFVLPLVVLVLACLGAATAQTSNIDLRSTEAVVIRGSRPPINFAEVDQGAAPAGESLQRMFLLLATPAAQEQALTYKLANLQNQASPEYHQWLTPAAFAAAYANSASDIAAVSSWLQSEGFTVAPLPAGRGWIEFSGTVEQVEQAFQTQVHTVATAAGPRPVIVGDISVPGALNPLVQGLVSLDGSLAMAAITTPQPVSATADELAAQTTAGNMQPLTPRLAAQVLHLDALQAAGVMGAGETIAIPSRSNVNSADVDAFRSAFALPAMTLKVVPNGVDPGLADDRAAATLAASWAGAAAPGAQIVLVPATTTDATDGLDLALAAIVDQNLAHTVAVGYSACEVGLSAAHQAFYDALYRQAAAEGIAVIAASGDSGASACHVAGSDAPVSSGFGVNALASTPWNTSVGVAAFGVSGPAAGTSVLNAWSPVNAADPAYASAGGRSILYRKPDWQPISRQLAAQPGAVAGGKETPNRLMPDLVLPTAIDSTANPGLAFCLRNSTSSGGCTPVRNGGSSAAAALFAGIAALVAEKNGAQGNLAPTLYALSGKSGVFTDIQQGSAQLKCLAGSPGCDTTGAIGFAAGTGYDLATGLGVPDANALVNQWASPQATGTAAATVTNTTASGQTIVPSGSVVLSVSVDSGTGSNPPTGTVNFLDQSTSTTLADVTLIPVSGGTSGASATITGALAQGSHSIVAQYSGDATYAAANSAAVTVNVTKTATTVTIAAITTSPTAGSSLQVTATIAAATYGTVLPTGTVSFTLDGTAAGTGNVVAGSPATATASLPIVSSGSHNVQAIYSGDNNYTTSTSASVPVVAAKGASVTVLTASPASPVPGVAETLTASIAPTNPVAGVTYSFAGTVNFYDGATLLGQVTVASNQAVLSGVTLKGNVSHSITAAYSGDGNWLESTSTALSLASTLLTDSVVLSANHSAVQFGTALILTATVVPTVAPTGGVEANPTGTVIFFDGTLAIGTASLTAVTGTDTATATLTTQTLAAGPNTITAVYQGDAYYASATSNPLTITVEDFTITPAASNPPTNLNINKGGAGSASFVITGAGGFNNTVQIVCAVPSQDNMTCTPSPQQVTPTATVTFVVQTFLSGSLASRSAPKPLFPGVASGTALAVLGIFLLPFGRRARKLLLKHAGHSVQRLVVLLLLLAGLAGTGIGCNSSTAIVSTGTPLGVATLKITGSAYVDNTVVSHSIYLTVNVLAPGATAP